MAETVSETYIYDLPSTVSPLAAGDKIIIEKASGGTKVMTYSEFIKAVAASMVTNAGTVTDDVHSVSGKQLNPNVSGTLAASIASLNSRPTIASSYGTLTQSTCWKLGGVIVAGGELHLTRAISDTTTVVTISNLSTAGMAFTSYNQAMQNSWLGESGLRLNGSFASGSIIKFLIIASAS